MNNIINEYFSIPSLILYIFGGNNENKIFDPSRGGTGIRLNIAKAIFIPTIYEDINTNELDKFPPKNLRYKPKTKAISIFARGPARDMSNSPILLFFIL